MQRMARLRELGHRSTLVVLCLGLGLSLACVRSEPLKPATESASARGKQPLPFHPEAQPVSVVSGGADPGGAPDPKSSGDLPFPAAAGTRVLPAGTLLTVQLENSLSAVRVHGGDAFTASVAAPLVVEGETVVERGAEVSGRVEAAQSRRGSGYVRLRLTAITIGGAPVPIQTSSLFATGAAKQMNVASGGNPSTQPLGGVRIAKGRQLTFRLIAPVTVKDSNSLEKGKSASAASE